MMARMRRGTIAPSLQRSILKRTGVSSPLGYSQKGSGVRFKGASLSLKNVKRGQSGKGKISKGLKKFAGSTLGREILAASVQSLGENASNPYAKTFGSSLSESMRGEAFGASGERKKKKSTEKTRQDFSGVTSESELSPEEYLRIMKSRARGRR